MFDYLKLLFVLRLCVKSHEADFSVMIISKIEKCQHIITIERLSTLMTPPSVIV